MYQAGRPPDTDLTATVQVILVFDVPAGFTELPSRTAQLADEFGRVIANSVPGVRARPAVIASAGDTPPSGRTGRALSFDGLLIDRSSREVRISGVPVRLSYREFELLCFLAEHPRQPVSRAQLMHEVWGRSSGDPDGPGTELSGRTVDTHVRRLRVKLGGYAGVITTIRGRGYRFDFGPDVRYVPAAANRHRA